MQQKITTSFPPISREHPVNGEPSMGCWYTEEEVEALTEVMRTSANFRVGFHPNPQVAEFEQAFAQYCGVANAFACTSAGTGLDLAMMALDLEPGDEVISQCMTFPGTHASIIGQGGTPVLAEIDPATFNIDPADVEKRITPRTRAILSVHDHGLASPVRELEELAARHSHPKHGPIKVIFDAARACGAGYDNGKKVGSGGWMTVFSFHTQKLLTTLGEGGMVTTDDAELYQRIRANGNWGSPERWGTNYRISRLQAVVGMVQLRRLDEMLERRRDRARKLRSLLQKRVPELRLATEPAGYYHTYYGFCCVLPDEYSRAQRDALCEWMPRETGVGLVLMNMPTYRNQYHIMSKRGFSDADFPVSVAVADRFFCPPMHPLFTDADLEYIADSLRAGVDYISRL